MMIHEITEKVGPHKKRKRVGRGPGSGSGKTAGRGHKGAHSRSGDRQRAAHEGGQMPLYRRLPKRGFSNVNFTKVYRVVNLGAIDGRFEDGAQVTPDMLVKVGLIHDTKLPVKVLGSGELKKKLQITAASFSESAKKKIEAAGGTANLAA